jgi:hypothetical protein
MFELTTFLRQRYYVHMSKILSFSVGLAVVIGVSTFFLYKEGVFVIPRVSDPPDMTSDRTISDDLLVDYAKSEYSRKKMMFKEFDLGKHNGIPVKVEFPCGDLCPDYTTRIIRYDVPLDTCQDVGGRVKDVLSGWMADTYCFPKVLIDHDLVENNLPPNPMPDSSETSDDNLLTDGIEISDDELIAFAEAYHHRDEKLPNEILLGTHSGAPVKSDYSCSDLCPEKTRRIIRYDVPLDTCEDVGGIVKNVLVPAGAGASIEPYCFPKILVDSGLVNSLPVSE